MGILIKVNKQLKHSDIDKMNTDQLRKLIAKDLSGKVRRKIKKIIEGMNDDDFMDNVVMEPKPTYKSGK